MIDEIVVKAGANDLVLVNWPYRVRISAPLLPKIVLDSLRVSRSVTVPWEYRQTGCITISEWAETLLATGWVIARVIALNDNESGGLVVQGRCGAALGSRAANGGGIFTIREGLLHIEHPTSEGFVETRSSLGIGALYDATHGETASLADDGSNGHLERMFFTWMMRTVFGATFDLAAEPSETWLEDMLHSRTRMTAYKRLGRDFGAVGVAPKAGAKPPLAYTIAPTYVPMPQEMDSDTGPLKGRRSTRRFAPRPVTLADVSRLLAPALALHSRRLNATGLEVASRGVAAAGAIHEVETFILLNETAGPRLYHYDAVNHCAGLIEPSIDQSLRNVLLSASAAINATQVVPAVLLFAARLDRLRAKYNAISYVSTCKHVGIILATLQLYSRDMGLGLCPLGSSPTDLFAKMVGQSQQELMLVGECVVGHPARARGR